MDHHHRHHRITLTPPYLFWFRSLRGFVTQAFRKWTAFIAHHPYIVAGVSLFMIFAMSGIAFAVVPFDQGGGNGAGNFMALGEKWVEEVWRQKGDGGGVIVRYEKRGCDVIPWQGLEPLPVFFFIWCSRFGRSWP